MRKIAAFQLAALLVCGTSFSETPKIGFIATLSGPRASIGRDALDAARLALRDLTEQSSKPPLELVVEDSAGVPRQGIDSYKKLLAQGIKFVITQNSNISIPISYLVNRDGVLQLAHATTADSYSREHDLTFRINGGTVHEAKTMAHELVLRGKKSAGGLAVLSMEDEYPRNLADNLLSELKRLGSFPAVSETFSPGTSDFRALIARLKGLGIRHIALLSYQTEAGLFVKQQAELGLNAATIISDVPVNNKEFFESASNYADGTLVTYIKLDESHPAVARYQAEYGRPVNLFAANGYDALMIANLALEMCGRRTDPDCLRASFPKIRDYKGLGGTKSFDERYGDMQDDYEILVARDGRFVPLP